MSSSRCCSRQREARCRSLRNECHPVSMPTSKDERRLFDGSCAPVFDLNDAPCRRRQGGGGQWPSVPVGVRILRGGPGCFPRLHNHLPSFGPMWPHRGAGPESGPATRCTLHTVHHSKRPHGSCAAVPGRASGRPGLASSGLAPSRPTGTGLERAAGQGWSDRACWHVARPQAAPARPTCAGAAPAPPR
jgi:hypothetical protein